MNPQPGKYDFAVLDRYLAAARQNPVMYGRAPVWVDTGTTDFFLRADTQFAHDLRAGGARVSFHVWPGGHADAHWDGHFPEYVHFFATALAHCAGSR